MPEGQARRAGAWLTTDAHALRGCMARLASSALVVCGVAPSLLAVRLQEEQRGGQAASACALAFVPTVAPAFFLCFRGCGMFIAGRACVRVCVGCLYIWFLGEQCHGRPCCFCR